jgi:hypothetical protein
MLDIILQKFGDHGSESSRRDEFQKHYAAYCCIEMLVDEGISEVICEYGEDVVVKRHEKYELYQVKTRQESMDDWGLYDLIPIIAKTFAMVPYFGNVSKCCFVSNEGAAKELYKLKNVINKNYIDWDDNDKQTFNDFCKNYNSRILKYMKEVDKENKDTVEDIKTRLLLLKLDTDFHHMSHIQDSNLRQLRHVLEGDFTNHDKFTYTDEELVDVYERIMGMVGKATIGKNLSEKTINRDCMKECVKIPLKRKTLYRTPTEEEINSVKGKTVMERKLCLGGFTQIFIETARELMVSTMYKARSWEFGDAPAILDDVRFRVKYLWADNYDRLCQAYPDQEKIGRILLEEIKKDLSKLAEHYIKSDLPIDDFFLLGTVWNLTLECKAYWSQNRIE